MRLLLLIAVCFSLIGCGDKKKENKTDSSGNQWSVLEMVDEGHTYRVFYRRSGHGGYCWSKHSVNCPSCNVKN
jgi:hypothetical protein